MITRWIVVLGDVDNCIVRWCKNVMKGDFVVSIVEMPELWCVTVGMNFICDSEARVRRLLRSKS